MKRHTFIWTLAIIAVIANLADAVTTFIALQYFSLAEFNPLMAFFYHYPFIGYPLKIIGVTWFLLPLPYCPLYKALNQKNRWVQSVGISGLVFAIIVFTLLAVNNVSSILNAL